jgi:hypothetical protein
VRSIPLDAVRSRRRRNHRPVARAERCRDRLELTPGLERTLFLPSWCWVVDAHLRRVDVDHSPDNGAVERLSQCLGGLEAVARRERHSPFCDFLRGQFADPPVAEHRGRFAEQPAQFLDRHRLHIMLSEIRLDQLGERQAARDPALTTNTIELTLERRFCVLLGCESATLHAPRTSAGDAVAIRPEWFAFAISLPQLEYLTLLAHASALPSRRHCLCWFLA